MTPNEKDAKIIVEKVKCVPVKSIQRFTTGNHHYVYDVVLENDEQLVARLTKKSEQKSMEGAVKWNKFFRPKGILLPKIIHYDLEHVYPYMLIERFKGKDLGFVFDDLSEDSLRTIAEQIGMFQKISKETVNSERFGYSVEPENAPFTSWSQVVESSISRSRKRILSTNVVDIKSCNLVEKLFNDHKSLMDKKSTPFLHDLTSKNVIISNSHTLSGVIDIDNLCFGDPTYHLALTKVALSERKNCDVYIKYLLEAFDGYDENLLKVYLAVFYLDFLAEIGQDFNGNIVKATPERINFLEKSIRSCL